MTNAKSNIILIGMAGCGKTSVGKMLAQKLDRPFVDTDDLIAKQQNNPLQRIIEREGPFGFRKIEESILLHINVQNHIIATGGSSIYSKPGMEHLKKIGVVILLQSSLEILEKRVGDTSERGLVKQSDQSFKELYLERKPLYKHAADIVIECSSLGHEEVCEQIVSELQQQGSL